MKKYKVVKKIDFPKDFVISMRGSELDPNKEYIAVPVQGLEEHLQEVKRITPLVEGMVFNTDNVEFAVAMENRKKINEIIEFINKESIL